MTLYVAKRDKREEPFDVRKLRVCIGKALGIGDGGLAEDIEHRVLMSCGMCGQGGASVGAKRVVRSRDILDALIRAASDSVSPDDDTPSRAVSRLMVYKMRTEAWGSAAVKRGRCPRLYDRIRQLVAAGLYDPDIITCYAVDEIDDIDRDVLRHERDFDIPPSGCHAFYDKYLLRVVAHSASASTASSAASAANALVAESAESAVAHSVSAERHADGGEDCDRDGFRRVETPQEANALIAMTLFMREHPCARTRRLGFVRQFYDLLSRFAISLPTPVYAGLRGTTKSFASCCVLDCADSVDGILATNLAVGKVITERYGVGIHCGRLRGIGSPIGGRAAAQRHCGVVPVLKMFEASVRGFSQGVRGGSAAVSFPFWHAEILTVVELRNNKGVSENRVRGLDYSVGLNRLFLERVRDDGVVQLFSPSDVPLLIGCVAYDDFKRVYEGYEASVPADRRTAVRAVALLEKIVRERYETGRLYVHFIDNANEFSPFAEPIFAPNLCQEVFLPTAPIDGQDGGQGGMSGVCVLACVNLGRVANPLDMDEMGRIAAALVRALNNLIDYQHYPFPHIRAMAERYRPLGIGVSDVFHLLALNGLRYDTAAGRNFVHRVMEVWQYSLLSASSDLARERGAAWADCGGAASAAAHAAASAAASAADVRRQCLERGQAYVAKKFCADCGMPRCKPSLDALTDVQLFCDWAALLRRIKQCGLLNACLSAVPPTSSSSLVSNSTPSVDPPRNEYIVKLSKAGTVRTVPPDCGRLRGRYTFARDIDNVSYIQFVAVIQKFVDQGVSASTYYLDSSRGAPSVGDLFKEVFAAYGYGLKSLYYLHAAKLSGTCGEPYSLEASAHSPASAHTTSSASVAESAEHAEHAESVERRERVSEDGDCDLLGCGGGSCCV